VSARLVERAMGYSHPDVDIRTISVGNGFSEIVKTPIIKHYPPDTAAASLWLRNRQPDKWRDKPEVSVHVENSITVDTNRPVEQWGKAELRAELARRNALPKIPVLKGKQT
jgi:ssDNA-binding replication factor A large subunit